MNFNEVKNGKAKPIYSKKRIQHLEDLILWDGATGAYNAIDIIKNINNTNITIKWDGCVEESTNLLTTVGLRTIKEIHDLFYEGYNIKVMGYDHINQTHFFTDVIDCTKNKVNNNWHEITTNKNKKYKLTENHLVYISDDYCLTVKEIKENDKILSSFYEIIQSNKIIDGPNTSYDVTTTTGNYYIYNKDSTILIHNSPSVVFGRTPSGEFFFTDKSGFSAKTYDGKATTPEEIYQLMLSRGEDSERKEFATKMATAFGYFKELIPKNFVGYYSGDILYFSPPKENNGNFIFQPNTVRYTVKKQSPLGKEIDNSSMGIALHYCKTKNKKIQTVKNPFNSNNIAVIPATPINTNIKIPSLSNLENKINKYKKDIDNLFNITQTSDEQLNDFSSIIYKYINSNVKTNSDLLKDNFTKWLGSEPNISSKKKTKAIVHLQKYNTAWDIYWDFFEKISKIKLLIIKQLDLQIINIKQDINNTNGGEGYVISYDDQQIKLVSRQFFTSANQYKHNR